ncbi:MAG: hypothetical protein ABW221_06300 [Vicinamibacteria bacterium]
MAARKRARATVRVGTRARRAERAAMDHGRTLAAQAIRARERRRGPAKRSKSASPGLLIAEGDSWFDYPFFDTLERLEDAFGYEIESVAHKGDTVEGMAYDESQTQTLARLFERVAGRGGQPRAILLSGGGNDIAGDELAIMLNHAASGLPPLNDAIVQGVIDVRLKTALLTVVSGVTALARHYFDRAVPVLIHGYARPVPDGRGYLGGGWILPGPWLKPGFTRKGYGDVKGNCALIGDLIDRFNAMLQTIPATPGLGHVTYVDMRPVLATDPGGPYKKTWNDELHPTKPGFELVAGAFDRVIAGLAAPGPRGRGPAVRRKK